MTGIGTALRFCTTVSEHNFEMGPSDPSLDLINSIPQITLKEARANIPSDEMEVCKSVWSKVINDLRK